MLRSDALACRRKLRWSFRSQILWRIAGAALAAKQSVGLIHAINYFNISWQPKPEDRAKVTARRADVNSIKAAEMVKRAIGNSAGSI